MKPSGAFPRLRRAALLLGALLHLIGTAAGPALHGWLRHDPHLAGISAERHEATFPPHDEHDCVVCQVVAGRALPEPGLSLALLPARRASAVLSFSSEHPAPALSGTRARAPPVSIA